MHYLKRKLLLAPLMAISLFFVACHTSSQKKEAVAVTHKDSVGNQPAKAVDTVIHAAPLIRKITLKDLLAHFKADANFPFVVDSAYCVNVSKKDSLGTSEIKMLVQKWYSDTLVDIDSTSLKDFYKIDSIKSTGTYANWLDEEADQTQVLNSNAYALKKVILINGQVLLIWALQYSDGADPLYSVYNIYFTLLNNGKTGETFFLGYYTTGVDPPAYGQTVLAGKLTGDGKLELEKNQYIYEGDTNVAQVNHALYTYSISNGNISLVSEKVDATKNVKVKNTEE